MTARAAAVEPLNLGCDASRCSRRVPEPEKRHAFLSSSELVLPGLEGSCRACGVAGLVNWERCHTMDPADIPATVSALRLELIRDVYWGEELPERIIRNARRHDAEQLRRSFDLALRRSLRVDHPLEGHQTYLATNDSATISHCAQHGTATCCRACLEKWYGIPRKRELTEPEYAYLDKIGWAYEEARLEEALL